MKLTIAVVLFIVSIALFVWAALVVDEHVAYGNTAVLTDLGLAVVVGAILARDSGH